jgi:large subunit ribosomal protein L6
MSRIGKQPINIPSGVTVTVAADNASVTVKGPKGELTQAIEPAFKISQEDSTLTIVRPSEEKHHKSLHGLYRALIAQSNVLELSLGYSHSIFVGIPPEIKVTATQEKGGNPTVVLEGSDKQLLGQVAAKIRSLRKVEPYKGKGIRFTGEYIRRKAGKAAAK